MSDIYLWIEGQKRGPHSEHQVRQSFEEGHITSDVLAWHDALTDWESMRSEVHEQCVILAGQSNGESFERKQGGTLLTGLDHLDVTLRHVCLYCEGILTQLSNVTQPMEVLPQNLERAFGCLVLHSSTMPNQGFA